MALTTIKAEANRARLSVRVETDEAWQSERTPTERLRLNIEELEAKLEQANERIYFLVAELATANARLGNTEYRTIP